MVRGRRGARVRPAEPHRRCVGCRQVAPQRELMRLVAEAGQAVQGPGKPGRGCWLHREASCAAAALKGGRIPRALKGKAAAPELPLLLEWMGLAALDGGGGSGLKS